MGTGRRTEGVREGMGEGPKERRKARDVGGTERGVVQSYSPEGGFDLFGNCNV